MFLCRDCHSKECSQDHFTGSNGPCEGCGKTANCSDCKSYKYKEPEEKRKYGTLPEGDGTHRLCMILYAQEDAAKYIGGSNAPMLHDAADRLLFYEKFVEAVQIYMATQGLAIHRFEDTIKSLAEEEARVTARKAIS